MAEKPKCRSSVVTHSIKTLKQIVNHYADMAQRLKRLPAMQETWVRSLGREDALEKEVAPHSSTLAWRIPWTEESGRLQSMESQRVGHDWATSLSLFTFMRWRRRWKPLQCSCLENPRDRGAWWAAFYGVAQSWTWMKRLSSSSSILYYAIYPKFI